MLIRLVSDIHLEFKNRDNFLPYTEKDFQTILVVAGDLNHGTHGAPWLNDMADRFRRVVYVIGNHELYRNNFDALIPAIRRELHINVHLLHRDSVLIDNVMFIGCPLWTDFNKGNPMDMMRARQYMNDYHHCFTNDGVLTPGRILDEHKKDLDWLTNALRNQQDKDEKVVVVTHHAPSYQSVHAQYRNDKLNCCFASELDHLFNYNIDYWLHGHSHRTVHYESNGVKVRQNPYGYYGHEVNPDFNYCLQLEV